MSDKISSDSVVSRVEGVVSSDINGELVMMDIERGQYYSLDPIGTDIWSRLEHPLKVQTLIDELRATYAVDAERCNREVLALLTHMLGEGLIEIIDHNLAAPRRD